MKEQETIISALNRLLDHYGHQKWWQSDNKVWDLISMVLIQRTTENNAKLAMANFSDQVSLKDLLDMPLEDLQERIRPAGFFTSKSQTIKIMAQFVVDAGGFEAFSHVATDDLRTRLLGLKGIGPETADVILLYLLDRKVFVADEYARRLFARLGFGDYQTYAQLRKEAQPLTESVSLETCQEWHAVIDQHGKAHRLAKGDLDESWLL